MSGLRTFFRRPGRHGEAIPGESLLLEPLAARHVLPQGYDMHPAALAAAPAETFPAAGGITFGEWDTRAARQEAASIFGPRPHGIATPDTLAEIKAIAAEQAAIEAAERQRIALEEAARTTPDPRLVRPYAEPAPSDDPTLVFRAVPWTPRVPAAESARRIAVLTYPEPRGTGEQPGGSREQYAAMARQVSSFTNSRSPKEQPSGWEPAFRSAGTDEPLRPWGLRPAVLALPAGTGAAA